MDQRANLSVEKLFAICVEREFRSDSAALIPAHTQANYANVWEAFVKWTLGQLEIGRAVNCQPLGIFGYNPASEDARSVYLQFSEHFLGLHELQLKDADSEGAEFTPGPSVKVNYVGIAKTGDLDKNLVASALNNLFSQIGELLASTPEIEINLGVMGRLMASNRQVSSQPMQKSKPSQMQGKSTVQRLMDLGKTYERPAAATMAPVKEGQPDLHPRFKKIKYKTLPVMRPHMPRSPGLAVEFLGAGTNPHARVQTFSSLASNPEQLMSTKFKKPPYTQTRFPPVLDAYSRTVAAPLMGTQQYIAPSARIASYYNFPASKLFIDAETRSLRFLPPDPAATLEANTDPMIAQLPTSGEPITATGIDTESLKYDYCVKRYWHYIEQEITTAVVAPVRQLWIAHILELIPADLSMIPIEKVEEHIDAMMNEFTKDYYDAVRKSILDYVLKQSTERKRLGIEKNPHPPVDYGSEPYKGIEPNEEWQTNVMMARMLMSDNLSICTPATLALKSLWAEYEHLLFVDLPERFDTIPLHDFIGQQENRMQEVKNALINEWIPRACEVLKNELERMDREQAGTFFEAVATLLHNQLRSLVTDSVAELTEFFSKFKLPYYPSPIEMIKVDCKVWPDSFLQIKLVAENGRVIFGDSLQSVQRECLKLIGEIIKQSEGIPRPDNLIKASTKQFLWHIDQEDEIASEATLKIKTVIEQNLKAVESALHLYDKYLPLLSERRQVERFILENHDRKEYKEKIEKFMALEREIRKECPVRVKMSMIQVECQDINRQLCKDCDDIVFLLTKAIASKVIERENYISKKFDEMSNTLSSRADNEEKLVQIEAFIFNCRDKEIPALFTEYENVKDWLKLLYETNYEVGEEETAPLNICYWWVNRIRSIIEENDKRINNERNTLESQLKDRRDNFSNELEDIESEINNLRYSGDRSLYKQVTEVISNLKRRLDDAQTEMHIINEKERQVGWNPTEFSKVDEAIHKLKPYDDLWRLAMQSTEKVAYWDKVPVLTLNPEEVDTESKQMFSLANKLQSQFGTNQNPANVARVIKIDLEKFRGEVPVIKVLCTPGMQERHFAEISKVISYDLQFDPSTTKYSAVKAFNLNQFVKELEDISQRAAREFSNFKMLQKMKNDWKGILFEIKEWGETGTYILLGAAVEVIQTLLDEQILTTSMMKSSPYAKVYQAMIDEWDDWLNHFNNGLKIWLKVQQLWIGLEPVFASADIRKQLANEATIFKEIDNHWRQIMDKTRRDLSALEVSRIENLNDTLKYSLEKLEHVQKELNNYLDTKRLSFPRFFFLSNDEMLSILKETRDPTRVQPHVKKCFDGIKSLQFDEEHKISAMISAEGEKVDFMKIIDPATSEGAVERWLAEVEDSMIKATREVIMKALLDYPKKDRKDWVYDHKGQAILTIAMTFWTKDAEEALISRGKQGLASYLDTCNRLLSDIVVLVRGKLPNLLRIIMKALIVLDVHARDVIQALVAEGVEDKNDFSWLAQMRYYWENENTIVRIINADMDYNYEYLGNPDRLVITPLTDRCYRTLCGAVFLNYGGAPEGPAGTGKTETVKDLSKALARLCVVFNCSDEIDFIAMRTMFKGLVATGGWSCFDEFNRIEAEVLSVIATQLLQIQNAVKDTSKDHFTFEESYLPIKRTCNCFITMNPGYAGRSLLPDNLKALFRPVAMMVPDYAMIAENDLYASGFHEGRPLAQKVVATYKLCSEQLSSQSHYDYGMRAVKSVLIAAGNLKQRYPEENEYVLMLRAINDVNLAKFLAPDLPLFSNIMSDLFPGIKLPTPDYTSLLESIHMVLKRDNLQPQPYFMNKIIQLYEMICVRHGLMIVGMPYASKTTAIMTLADALTDLAKKNLMGENEVLMHVLNPKAVNSRELYGTFDKVSKDWEDGVLAFCYKDLARNDSKQRKWLVFDGPVDAIWIESMNTVLDDNKKLCLPNLEVIAMSQNMNLIFEPMDLAVASPATVSRCGMVYVEPAEMGWRHLYESWLNVSLPNKFTETEIAEVVLLCDWLIEPTLNQVKGKLREIAPNVPQNMVISLLKMFQESLKVFEAPDFFEEMEDKERIKVIDCLFLYCLVWSLGSTVISQHRRNFNIFLSSLLNGDLPDVKKAKKIIPTIPDRGSCYDFLFIPELVAWKHWTETEFGDVNKTFPPTLLPNEIIVPTVDTIRYSYILANNIRSSRPTLFCGNTGTGKTVYIKQVLYQQLDQATYMNIEIGFSAQTTCTQVQEIIEGKINCKRHKNFGPPPEKIAVIFVDDLNMPEKEEFGAQPPVEILRQFLDQGGWYDRKEIAFKNYIDTKLVAAMGPPGGGRTFITPRFQRHLHLIALAEFDDDSLLHIFSSILRWYFAKGKFSENVTKIEHKLVQASMEIYKASIEKLLPTPAKSHYTFNLRDFAKVISGICLSDAKTYTETDQIVRLWAHEIIRVFGDRLVDESDMRWLIGHTREVTKKIYGFNFDVIFGHLDNDKNGRVETPDEIRGMMFGYLMKPLGGIDYYEEMTDMLGLRQQCESALEMYNSASDKPMHLVMFSFAIEHLCRISRIIHLPGGHALLIGVGGSGRQSLTILAAFMAEFEVFRVELTRNYNKDDWREDCKRLLKMSGGGGKETIFLFTDSQIKDKSFLEDINNLLNTGEVPNLFPPEERPEICEMVRAAAKTENKAPDGTPEQLYNFFVQRCRKLLHIVLCFSPIGEAFRTRLRMFPSLVNCTSIDWFSEWPQDALVSVAESLIGKVELETHIKKECVLMCQLFHQSTIDWSAKMYRELKRHYYVTPTSYLEMISTFTTLLNSKRKEVIENQERYRIGLEKLVTTEGSVEGMKKELNDKKPKLELAAIETEKKFKIVEANTIEAEKVKSEVEIEARFAKEKADSAMSIKAECDRQMAEAQPLLDSAMAALDNLDPKDFVLMKTYTNPPANIQLLLEAVVVIMQTKVERKQNPNTMQMEPQYWPAAQKLLTDPQLINNLKTFHTKPMNEKGIFGVKKYIAMPQFNPATMAGSSQSAEGLCKWVIAIEKFYYVNKEIEPKKIAQAEAQNEYETVMKGLRIKQAELKEVNDKLNALRTDLKKTQDYQEELQNDVADCERRLIRAEQLISSLGDEKTNWTERERKLGEYLIVLTGDVLLSSGVIAYLGPFISSFRQSILAQWIEEVVKRGIPSSSNYTLQSCLGDPVKIRTWHIDGLPKDSFSIDNGIMISKSRRWPLMIDPQNQANKWIKKMENKEGTLLVLNFNTDNFLKKLETKIAFGHTVLLENVGEELDPSLEPLLLKQIVKNTIKLSSEPIEYNPEFRFYITSKLRNPHYLPEISVKVTLLNFMITPEGLADQLLVTVVAEEQPELARRKEELIIKTAHNKEQLKIIEEKILQILKNSQGNILDDDEAIRVLSQSKAVSNQIEEEQKIAEETEKEIDAAREQYKPFSECMSLLFFCVSDLGNIDPMYQYSLEFFSGLFKRAIYESEPADEIPVRLEILKEKFVYSLYLNVCRSLFVKNRLLFAFTLTLKFMEYDEILDGEELRFFMTGGIGLDEKLPDKPDEAWVTEKMWAELCRLTKLKAFHGFTESFARDLVRWSEVVESLKPHEMPFPGRWQEDLNPFEKLLVIRVMRIDAVIPAVTEFIANKMGRKFVDPIPFVLKEIYKDSASYIPLIFILSPGSDPFISLNKFAEAKRKEIKPLSLGQGQGPKAEEMIKKGIETGNWVILQNCHLAKSFMPILDKITQEISPDPKQTHRDFRLWLTSYPSNVFPVTLLQNSIKMTNEPPQGLKANLSGSYAKDPINDPVFFSSCKKELEWKKLLFGLCFFNAVIQERRNYGPLGWNIPYEFTESDLQISVRQLQIMLNEYDVVPFKALRYLTCECNFGGRVTDDKDRRLIITLLEDYYTEEIFNDNYRLSPLQEYYAPSTGDYQSYIEYIENLPVNAPPEVYGLHANADITKNQQDTLALFESLLTAISSGGGGSSGSSVESLVIKIAENLLTEIPQAFDVAAAEVKYPVLYNESMNTVLTQELMRFNKLTNTIKANLSDIKKAITGQIPMSVSIEASVRSLFDGKVPKTWIDVSYPSLKPLGSYITDLKSRLEFFKDWLSNGIPVVYYISRFYFTQGFLTGALQNYARKAGVSIDRVKFNFQVIPDQQTTSPEDGIYITGMFLEGARWDSEAGLLAESNPKVLFTSSPTIWLKPNTEVELFPHYECPLYKTSERRGVLSTTGHSTNFVMLIKLKTDLPAKHWIKRGVAMLTQLDD